MHELIVLKKNKNDKKLCAHILANPKILRSISEIVFQILHKNIGLGQHKAKLLKHHKTDLLDLANKRTANHKKYEILVGGKKRGGWLLSTILGLALPILTKLLFGGGK